MTSERKYFEEICFLAHHENILLSMLADTDDNIRRAAANKALSIRGKISNFVTENEGFEGGFVEQDDEDGSTSGNISHNLTKVCKFLIPKLYF